MQDQSPLKTHAPMANSIPATTHRFTESLGRDNKKLPTRTTRTSSQWDKNRLVGRLFSKFEPTTSSHNLKNLSSLLEWKTQCCTQHEANISWAVLNDEQMGNGWPFTLLNDKQRSNNKVRVEHEPENRNLGGCFNFVCIHLYLGKWSNLICAYFSDGLVQPPIRNRFHVKAQILSHTIHGADIFT